MAGVMLLSILAGLFALALGVFYRQQSHAFIKGHSYDAGLHDGRIFLALHNYALHKHDTLSDWLKTHPGEFLAVKFEDLISSGDVDFLSGSLISEEYGLAVYDSGDQQSPTPTAIMVHKLPFPAIAGAFLAGAKSVGLNETRVYGSGRPPSSRVKKTFGELMETAWAGDRFALINADRDLNLEDDGIYRFAMPGQPKKPKRTGDLTLGGGIIDNIDNLDINGAVEIDGDLNIGEAR